MAHGLGPPRVGEWCGGSGWDGEAAALGPPSQSVWRGVAGPPPWARRPAVGRGDLGGEMGPPPWAAALGWAMGMWEGVGGGRERPPWVGLGRGVAMVWGGAGGMQGVTLGI